MSCQQLIQEDPYVFTDNISNPTNFMQQNISQTKYVPLNRQTIYSRQFRQHEPSIASSENVSLNGHQSPSQKHSTTKKNGLVTRTSPKFFNLVNNCNNKSTTTTTTTHHSITVSSSSSQPAAEASPAIVLATTCENGNNNITGIKQAPLSMDKLKVATNRTNCAVVVEPVLTDFFHVPSIHLANEMSAEKLSRDERIAQRKLQLRRRVQQFKGIQHYRTTERSKVKFSKTLKLLKHLDRAKEEIFRRPLKSCQFDGCSNEAIFTTLHCIDHILLADREQHMVRQCCFLYGHGEQCRMPVSDVIATIAVCNEHQNAHSHQLLDPAKPKKTTQVARKRVAIANKEPAKKKKAPIVKPVMVHGQKKLVIHPHDIQKPMKVTTIPKQEIVHENHQFIHHNSGNLLASSQSSYSSIASASDDLYLKQDLMTICENSYESSEDTGVGGLSENELMSHDVIGSLDMESSDELTKVLCSLPTNTLDDLLTEPLQTSRDDEEYLDRAIEEVSSVGIDQIAIGFDHLDGLGDMLEMMDDEEQRQMISAATNLISMSGMQSFLSNHDQDYSAMPSPMMS